MSLTLIRATLPTRQTFFDDLRALTRDLLLTNWDALMGFMMRGLPLRQTALSRSWPDGRGVYFSG